MYKGKTGESLITGKGGVGLPTPGRPIPIPIAPPVPVGLAVLPPTATTSGLDFAWGSRRIRRVRRGCSTTIGERTDSAVGGRLPGARTRGPRQPGFLLRDRVSFLARALRRGRLAGILKSVFDGESIPPCGLDPPVLVQEGVEPVENPGVVALVNSLENFTPQRGARRQIRTYTGESQKSVRRRALWLVIAGGTRVLAVQVLLVIASELLCPGGQVLLVGDLLPRRQTHVAVGAGTRRGGLHDGTVRNFFKMGYGLAFRK